MRSYWQRIVECGRDIHLFLAYALISYLGIGVFALTFPPDAHLDEHAQGEFMTALADALAQPARLVPVAFFDRLMGAGRRARRHRRAAEAAVLQRHLDLHRRVAPAVEDLAGVDVENRGHLLRPRFEL